MFKIRARKRLVGSLLAIGALALGSVLWPTTVAPAQASAVPCPVNPGPAGIDGWYADWASHGVTLCVGLDGEQQRVMVQIIDLVQGARLATASRPVIDPQPNPADNEFGRLTLSTWAANQRVQAPNSDPFPNNYEEAFSATNASFFTNTSSNYTKLSLPYKNGVISDLDQSRSYGVNLYNNDPGSSVAKRVLKLDVTGSQVQIAGFPTVYTAADAACSTVFTCVVGYEATTDLSGNGNTTNFRTYVGTNAGFSQYGTRAFILTGANLTTVEAYSILRHFGALATMQLDGGGSTYMWSHTLHFGGALNRAVPNVLLVKYAPNA